MVLTYFLNDFEMVPVAPINYYWYHPSFYIPHTLYLYCKMMMIIIIIIIIIWIEKRTKDAEPNGSRYSLSSISSNVFFKCNFDLVGLFPTIGLAVSVVRGSFMPSRPTINV
jgi:hypothetical protein